MFILPVVKHHQPWENTYLSGCLNMQVSLYRHILNECEKHGFLKEMKHIFSPISFIDMWHVLLL